MKKEQAAGAREEENEWIFMREVAKWEEELWWFVVLGKQEFGRGKVKGFWKKAKGDFCFLQSKKNPEFSCGSSLLLLFFFFPFPLLSFSLQAMWLRKRGCVIVSLFWVIDLPFR